MPVHSAVSQIGGGESILTLCGFMDKSAPVTSA